MQKEKTILEMLDSENEEDDSSDICSPETEAMLYRISSEKFTDFTPMTIERMTGHLVITKDIRKNKKEPFGAS